MIHTKKFTEYLLLYCMLMSNSLFGYPIVGEFYKFMNEDSTNGHHVLMLVDANTPIDQQAEKQFKANTLPCVRKLLFDNEINLILAARIESVSSGLKKLIDIWNNEFENDPQWTSIVEQNYSSATPASIVYKKMTLAPREVTRLFVILSKMKKYVDGLPLKKHLNFVQKIGDNKDNNLFRSCRYAKDYFKLNRITAQHSATLTFADWRTPTIMNITNNYKNGLETLSQNLYFVDKQLWPNSLEDLARTFVPQNSTATEFSPADLLKIKDLLDDLDGILKRLDQLDNASIADSEKKLWSNFKIKIQNAKEYILNAVSIFQNLSEEDKRSFEHLFKTMPKYQYAQLHWFAIVYAYMLKDKNTNNTLYPDYNTEWLTILTKDLLFIGLMEAILDSKIKQTKALIYLDHDTYKTISQYLLDLGYSKTLACGTLETDAALSKDELRMLANQFPVNILSIKQILQKPLTCSITI